MSAGHTDQERVLVVDDEPIVREVLSRYLSREGFAVRTAADGEAALAELERYDPGLVILDVMLPRIDGLEVLRRISPGTRTDTAVILLTARGEETDRVVGLELGADDYVSKPFSPREVVARAKAVLRRTAAAGGNGDLLRFDRLEIDRRARELRVAGAEVALTPREFQLLELLASRPRMVISRYELLEQLWDVAFAGDPATVTVHIRRLREKIELDPSDPQHLITVWGAGYRFDP